MWDMGRTQWFCGDHTWGDYRLGNSRRTRPDMEISIMKAAEIPRAPYWFADMIVLRDLQAEQFY